MLEDWPQCAGVEKNGGNGQQFGREACVCVSRPQLGTVLIDRWKKGGFKWC